MHHRVALSTLMLPKSWAQQHMSESAALLQNAGAVTSHFDMHATLRDMLGLVNNMENVVPGRSYFKPVSLIALFPPSVLGVTLCPLALALGCL